MAYSIPNVPGVPDALSLVSGFESGLDLLTSDALGYFSGQFGPQWGIFNGGSAVVEADAVVAFEYRQEWAISDYPTEDGGFQSFNKVNLPFDVRVTYTAGGSEANKAALLSSISSIASDLKLYDVVSPEATYTSCNVMHYNYRRTAENGVGLLKVDVWLLQVITQSQSSVTDGSLGIGNNAPNVGTSGSESATGGSVLPIASNPSSPAAAPQENGGTVNPVTASSPIDTIPY